jgi:hypothetical protein
MALAGFRSIHSDSSQKRRNPRRYSSRLTAEVAANFHVFRKLRRASAATRLRRGREQYQIPP